MLLLLLNAIYIILAYLQKLLQCIYAYKFATFADGPIPTEGSASGMHVPPATAAAKAPPSALWQCRQPREPQRHTGAGKPSTRLDRGGGGERREGVEQGRGWNL